ncbi:MAG: precorrin-3B C(17)-methyltransferase [bacterium]|nr:precorrin-3B C(17)-methyltransferase [bacterium]
MSGRARHILESVDAVVGYTTYIDLIRPLVSDKQIVSTGMKKEVERVEAAIQLALDGTSCAIVSSGDPGIYAMAGLVFEMCQLKNIPIVSPNSDQGDQSDDPPLRVEVAPGIPALCSGAALLGAPLTHDFAAISLSDLLTPWELIERRIEAAAAADFVIVLYNPKSKRRTEQLEKAQKIVLRHRSGETPVGVVTSASRDGQQVRIVPLKDLHTTPVNMLTTVFIGSSASTRYLGFMVTPRGYSGKYKI